MLLASTTQLTSGHGSSSHWRS